METQEVKIIPRQIIQAIEKMVYEKNGHKFIDLGSYCLDFKQTYVFLGFTAKKSKVILGDIYQSGPGGVKYTKRFGKVDKRTVEKVNNETVTQFKLVTDGYRYSETIMEIVQ
jgi:hypothetical protein